MKKRYKLESGMDTSITLGIDTDKIPEALAREINAFWVDGDYILDLSDGDAFQAVARRAAGPLLSYLMDGDTPKWAVKQLSENDGWPDAEDGGITIIDHDIPELGSDIFDVTEIAA